MPRRRPEYVTATDIYRFMACPHWPYYDWHATPEQEKLRRELTEAEIQRQEDGVAHEERVVQDIFRGQPVTDARLSGDVAKDCVQTLKWMREGVERIYQGAIVAGRWAGRPDILEKRAGESAFGDWHYVALDIKSTRELEKYQKFQLAFYSRILEHLQGRCPTVAGIYNVYGMCVEFDPAEVAADFDDLMAKLEASVFDGVKPELVLRKDCFDTGVWGELCRRTAEEADDIALLYNVNLPKLRALRSLGISTLADAAALDPATLAGAAPGLTAHALETLKLQAQSLRDRSVIIRKPVELSSPPLEIHFDIESSPPHGIDYLYGFLLRWPDGKEDYVSFVSKTESRDAEGEMWRQFLDWLTSLPLDYVVYHYSSYELGRLSALANRHGTSHWLDFFRSRMVDLSEYAKHGVTFPLYFYGLKHVAKFLGFRWRGELVKSGGESVDQFARYLETGDESILQAIIDYNEDDVRATAHLKDWLARYARETTVYSEPFPWQE